MGLRGEGVYRVLVGKPGERDQWGVLGIGRWIILGRICGDRVVYRFLVGKTEGKRPLWRPRRSWFYNIRMDL